MWQTPGGDVGINPLIGAYLNVGLAPAARIRSHHSGQRTGGYSDALEQLLRKSLRLQLQVFDIRRLVAHAQRHDQLMVAVDSQLAVVALDVVAIGFHHVAIWLDP